MRNKRKLAIGLLALLTALLFTFSPPSARSTYASSLAGATSHHTTIASSSIGATSHHVTVASSTWKGVTTSWANVRTGPGTRYARVGSYAPNTTVTIYATVSGQVIWGGISKWYRISNFGSRPLYIYGGLIVASHSGNNGGGGISGSARGKEILISLSRQWMYVFQDGKQIYNSPITSGRPELRTPTGIYHVFLKLHPTTFYSPWPHGSPYWYPPTHINYALEWRSGGLFLHDSWWRSVYGPGTNVWHHDPVYGWETGTHGCVTMPLSAAAWLYNWAPIGTMVKIQW